MTSDTRPWRLVAVVVLSLCAAGCAGTGPADDGANVSTGAPIETSGSPTTPTGPFLDVEVTRVSDGDSFRAVSSEGELEVRLLGVNSPEVDECFGAESAERLSSLLGSGSVSIGPWPGETDPFGRTLAMVRAGSTFVNLDLVESGHAVARAQSDHGFEREFEAAEERASEARIGLWAEDACGEPSDVAIVIARVEANAPGDDRENPNGEWVLIRNDDDRIIDLAGWVVRDESTRHRYEFGELTLEPGASVRLRSGCGADDFSSDPLEVHWCDPEPPIWNNAGDTAFLLDQNGTIADYRQND